MGIQTAYSKQNSNKIKRKKNKRNAAYVVKTLDKENKLLDR